MMICKLQDINYCTIYTICANVVIIIRSLSLANFDYDYVTNRFTEHPHFKSTAFRFFLLLIHRSPSPEPIYSSDGKRLNTREFRYRKRLEEQRHQLIVKMQAVNPEFKPPADYK